MPYLSLTYKTNLVSWLQLRGYLYVLIISSMINTEVWMISLLVAEFILVIIFIILLVSDIGDSLHDIWNIFASNSTLVCLLFLIILGIVYVFSVLYISSRFHRYHLKQIQQIAAQSMESSHMCIVEHKQLQHDDDVKLLGGSDHDHNHDDDDSEIKTDEDYSDEDNEDNRVHGRREDENVLLSTSNMIATQIEQDKKERHFLRTLKYLETHNITPRLIGIRMDKVVLRSLITLFLSSVLSLIAVYVRS